MLIEIKQLVKRYKELIALDHFDFHVEEGEIVGLLGPNGSGKTTLINCMLSLLKYDQGSIEIFGRPAKPGDWENNAKIGVVPQELAFFKDLTVQENIDYFCGLYVSDPKQRHEMVEEAIRFTGLESYKKFRPKKLSGGLMRRLNIACGIAHQPKLLFLDEPTVAVDAQSRNFILEGVREMNRRGTTVVYTTHYLEEAEQICSRIVILDKGKNLASGTLTELQALINTGEILHLRLTEVPEDFEAKMAGLPHLQSCEPGEDKLSWRLTFGKRSDNLLALLHLLQQEGLVYTELYSERPSLNEVFLQLTGKGLRD